MSEDTKESGDRDWIDVWKVFPESMRAALANRQDSKGQFWKGMAVDVLVSGALQHLGKFQDGGRERVELVHAANYLMFAWARIVEGECPRCGEKMRHFKDDSQKSWTPITGYICESCGHMEI